MSHDFKVGDEIVIERSYTGPCELLIETIETITKTGRIKTKSFEINPDLTIRGKRERWGPFYKCLGKPTVEHLHKIARTSLERTYHRVTRNMLSIRAFSDDDLYTLNNIYKKYQKKDD